MRIRFDEQLDALNKHLIMMGSLCEHLISTSLTALIEGDRDKAADALLRVDEINGKERQIEDLCIKLLLQQQPVARDLRTITAALKMVTDMKRIADQAGDISEIVRTGHTGPAADADAIKEMAEAAAKMVTRAIDAFVNREESLAFEVIRYDDVVDGLFDTVKNLLVEELSAGKVSGEYAIDLLMVAKYLERIADHAENIANWVLFSLKGGAENLV